MPAFDHSLNTNFYKCLNYDFFFPCKKNVFFFLTNLSNPISCFSNTSRPFIFSSRLKALVLLDLPLTPCSLRAHTG